MITSRVLFSDIEAGRELAIVVTEGRGAELIAAPAGPWRWDDTGPTSYDIPCLSSARVRGREGAPAGVQRLRLDRPWPQRAAALAHRYAGRFSAVTDDGSGNLRLCGRRFSSAERAVEVLRSCGGTWLVLFMQPGRLHPRLAGTDPFAREHPMAGSYVAAASGELRGPFVGPREQFAEWILTHFPSGYYGVDVLERLEVVEEPGMPRILEASHPCRVFLRREDGSASAQGEFPDVATACAVIRSKPGRWLLARPVETVSLY
jgi:hypothetical protein